MESFIEALRSGSIPAWAGFVISAIFIIRLLLKYSKWLVLLGVVIAIGYGLIKFFPRASQTLSEWFQSFSAEKLPEILQENIIELAFMCIFNNYIIRPCSHS